MAMNTSAMPIGVIEKIPRPSAPVRSSRLSASRNAGADTRVRQVPSDAASDIGISRREVDKPFALAKRVRIGNIIAVTITWWVNDAIAATAGIVTATARASLLPDARPIHWPMRSEEHTSELQSLMRISYAVFCLKKKKSKQSNYTT